jgi:hypothetical protein
LRHLVAIACCASVCACSLLWDLDPDGLPDGDGTTEDTTELDGVDAADDGLLPDGIDVPVDVPVDVPGDDGGEPSGLCVLQERSQVTHTTDTPMVAAMDWTDTEYGLLWLHQVSILPGMRFARIGPDGTVAGSIEDLSPPGLDGTESRLDMEWTGTGHGAIWSTSAGSVSFVSIGADGRLAGTSTPVSSGAINFNRERTVDLEWAGTQFAMAWSTDLGSTKEVLFARLDDGGGMLGDPVTAGGGSASSVSAPAIEWTGSEFGLAWSDDREGNLEIYFARIGETGTVLATGSRITNDLAPSKNPRVLWTGSEYALTWIDGADTGEAAVTMARLTPDGTVVDTASYWEDRGTYYFEMDDLGWSGSEIVVGWISQVLVGAARFDPLLNRLGGDLNVYEPGPDPSFGKPTAGAWSGSEFGHAWTGDSYGNLDLFFARAGYCE